MVTGEIADEPEDVGHEQRRLAGAQPFGSREHKSDHEQQPYHYQREDESDQVLHGVDDRFTPVALSLCSVLGSSAQSLRESFAQSSRGRRSQRETIRDQAR